MADGIGGMLVNLLGGQDPRQQLYQQLGQGPGQPGSPAGPQPLAPGGPGGGAPSPAPPTGGGAPAGPAGPGGPGGPQQPPPQPQAYTSPPDLAQLYMQMTQRDQQAAGINRGLGALFSAMAKPQNKQAMLGAFGGDQPNTGAMFNNVLQLQQFQQQQQRLQQMQQNLPQIAQSMGLPLSVVQTMYASDPAGFGAEVARITEAKTGLTGDPKRGEFVRNQTQWFEQNAQKDAQGNAMKDAQGNYILPPGVSAPPEITNQTSFEQKQKQGMDLVADQNESLVKQPALNQRADETTAVINRIKTNPKLDAALSYLTSTGGVGAGALAKTGAMDPQTYQAIQDIQQLTGQVYGEGFSGAGSKRTQTEVASIVSGLSQLKSTGQSGADYIKNAIAPLEGHLAQAKATSYGASGLLDQAPINLRGLIDKQYLPGGSMYNKGTGGGAWAANMDLTPEEEQSARDLIAKGQSPGDVRSYILQQGKRPPAWL
jgi:hypothetical protein